MIIVWSLYNFFWLGIPYDDEPPPLDDLEHSILPKNIRTGYFSGGQGLFDDNEDDEPFWGQLDKQSKLTDEPTIKEPKQHKKSKVNQCQSLECYYSRCASSVLVSYSS